MRSTNKFKDLYKKLNNDQKIAVDTIDGPVLVIAGPGTGKTQVLTMRIANILLKTDTAPDAILALTFTESGVSAMRERLLSIVGTTSYYVNIHTFHSFASEVIKSNPEEFIISTQLEPLSDLERIYIFKEVFDELELKEIKPFNAPYFYLQTVVSKIKDLKREGVSPKEFQEILKNAKEINEKDVKKNIELQLVYKKYQEKLIQKGRYDFEDMINFVLDKFKSSTELLNKYQERFQYFLVDEFQDTNSAQAELLYLINSFWKEAPNLFVVGDDDQSIYRFQGASIENIIAFNSKFPNSRKIVLKTNYRSNQKIIDASQNIIEHNKIRIGTYFSLEKKQKSQVDARKDIAINYGEFSSSHTENFFIAKTIKKLIKNGVPANEIAVIYRNNADCKEISDMLARLKIRYSLEGGENVLESGIITRLLHLLNVISKIKNKTDDLDFFTLLNYEFMETDPLDVLKISRFASTKKINLFEAFQHSEFSTLELTNPEKFINIEKNIIKWNKTEANVPFIEFLERLIEESNYLNWILNRKNSHELLNKLNSFLAEVKRLNHSDKGLNLDTFLGYLSLMKENNIQIKEVDLDIKLNAVKLMTAHKSKGLEYSYVFIPMFIDKKWSNKTIRHLIKLPRNILKTTSEVTEKEIQIEDERRLFYVALTRTKHEVFITSSSSYHSFNYSFSAVPSMFIHEVPENLIKKIEISEFEKSSSEILNQLIKPTSTQNTSFPKEAKFLKHTLRDFKLSPSSLNTYIECPYKFKLQFLFKTPELRSKALILGIAIHKTLEEAYKKLKNNKPIDLEYVKRVYTNKLESEILDETEFRSLKTEGFALLKTYLNTYKTDLTPPLRNPIFLEKFLGWGFSKPLLDGHIHLQGKIDKMEIINRNEKEIKITDYKTGRPKSRNEILGKTQYSTGSDYRQLLFYKLLVELDNSLHFRVYEVELDFLGNRNKKPKRESFKNIKEDAEELKDIIRDVHKRIMNLQFEKTNDYSKCKKCKYKDHCWPDGIPTNNNEQLSLNIP